MSTGSSYYSILIDESYSPFPVSVEHEEVRNEGFGCLQRLDWGYLLPSAPFQWFAKNVHISRSAGGYKGLTHGVYTSLLYGNSKISLKFFSVLSLDRICD
jgi:hypothetical protein